MIAPVSLGRGIIQSLKSYDHFEAPVYLQISGKQLSS